MPDSRYINLIFNAYKVLGFDYDMRILREALNYSFKRAKSRIINDNKEKYKIEKRNTKLVLKESEKKSKKNEATDKEKVLPPVASKKVELDVEAEEFYYEIHEEITDRFTNDLTTFVEDRTNALIIADTKTGEPFFIVYPVDSDGEFSYEFLKDGSRGFYKDVHLDSFIDYVKDSLSLSEAEEDDE